MKIRDRQIGPGHEPYIIAELGVNHDGSVDRALALVEVAGRCQADAIKLQWFDAGRLLSRAAQSAAYQAQAGAGDPRLLLEVLRLDGEQMARVLDRARELGLHGIVTVFSLEDVREVDRLPWDALKVASPDIINRPLIEALMATGKPLLLSTGAATSSEVEEAVGWLGDHPHVLLQCVSAYPTPDDQASLAGRAALARVDPWALGYSDHTTATDTGALAIAAGACLLEKHVTYDQTAPGPDHAASLEAEAFAEYVRGARRAAGMLGPARKVVLEIERDVREVSRQSLTAAQALPAGHVLHREDLTIKRPGTGLPPARLERVLGRRLRRAVERDHPLSEEDLA